MDHDRRTFLKTSSIVGMAAMTSRDFFLTGGCRLTLAD